MDLVKQFQLERSERINQNKLDDALQDAASLFLKESLRAKYSYNFSWMGRPVIQYPQDLTALQEIIWTLKPDLIVETGIAHGGSLVMSASMLALIDYCEAVEQGQTLDPKMSNRRVLGIDIDIRAHNRAEIEAHPMAHMIEMIEGSSIDSNVVNRVKAFVQGYNKILVCLDSNHTHEHVMAELEAYAPLTSKGSYCIIWDTCVEDLPEGFFTDRPWGKGNNPKTAVWEYLRQLDDREHFASDGSVLKFEIDKMIESKVMITAASDGFLKRIPVV